MPIKKLISLISTKGKTLEQIKKEAREVYKKQKKSNERATKFAKALAENLNRNVMNGL